MNIKISTKHYISAILSITVMVVLLIWRSDNPYPLSLDWDLYAHQHAFNAIKHGYFSLFPSQISDTFLLNTYLPTFALLLGGLHSIFGFLSETGLYFVVDTVHFIVNVFVGALLGYAVTRRYAVALVSGLLAACIYESVVAQTALFFTPQNFAAVIITLGLTLWILNLKRLGIIVLTVSILIHYVIGLIGLVLAALLIFQPVLKRRYGINIFRLLPMLGFLSLVTAVLFSIWGEFNPFSSKESTELIFGFWSKLEYLLRWYSLLIIGYLVGAWYLFRSGNEYSRLILGLSFGLLAAVILPVPYTLKFFTVGRFLVNVVLAVGLVTLLDGFSHKILRWISYGLLWLLLINLFVHSSATFKSAFPYHGVITTISEYELEAIDVIKESYPDSYGSVLIVSDPATQHVFEALTGINSQGGAFATNQTRTLLSQTYPNPTQEALFELFSIEDGVVDVQPEVILLIVSGRYIQWQNLPADKKVDQTFNVWAPRDLTARANDYIDMLEKTGIAKLIYINAGVSVFEIRKP